MTRMKWFRNAWGLLALLGAALACGLPLQPASTPTAAAKKAAPTQTELAVIELVASATPTLLPPTDVPTAVPTEDTQPWRIAPFPGAIRLGTDQSSELDPKWSAIIDSAVRELGLLKPTYFEIYDLRDGVRFADVRSYYDKHITPLGLNKIHDEMGGNGNGTAVWAEPHDNNHRYAIRYYSATPSLQARMFIIYANPR